MAVLVVLRHSFPLANGRDVPLPLGRFAVAVFFVISGHLIPMSWERSTGLTRYLRRRVARIVPGFVIAYAISAWIVGPLAAERLSDWYGPERLRAGVCLTLLMHDVAGEAFMGNPYPRAVNGSIWTIRYEFICYVLVAVAGILGFVRRRWVVASAFALVWKPKSPRGAAGCTSTYPTLGRS